MRKIKIILVDDHQMFREGLKFVLKQIPEFEIIGEASNGQEYLKLVQHALPDVVLMDIGMPVMDGVDELEKAIKSVCSGNAYFSQELLRNIIVNISNPKVTSRDPFQLTKREEEVLQMLCKGFTTKEISDMLFISQKTVEGHKTNL